MECKVSVEESTALVKARIAKRQSLPAELIRSARVRAFGAVDESSPTKALDAVVLANTLVGYGENISLENMVIIENVIKFAKLEANYEVPGNEPEAWYRAFVKCMEDAGCFIADSGYSVYKKSTMQLTMNNIVVDIVQAGVAAAKAAIPGATVLSAVADSTLDALKKEPEAINLLNREAVQDKGVRLAVLPCDQLKNGIILASLSSIDSIGGNNETSPLFFNWKTTNRSIFRGSAYITFNPLRYAALKDSFEEYLGEHFKAALSKRFQRRKTK